MESRATLVEPRWQRWTRNFLLTLGVSRLAGFVLFLLMSVEALILSGRIFSGTRGAILLELLSTIAPLASAVVVGFVSAYFLVFKRAELAVLAVGVSMALSLYFGVEYFVEPEWWKVAVRTAEAILLPILMVGTFCVKRWHLRGRPRA